MRILFVTNRFPGLLMHGDQARAYHQIRLLSAAHAITLLAFEPPPPGSPFPDELRACCEQVIVARRNPVGIAVRLAGALGGRLPLQVAMYDSGLPPAAARLLARGPAFDLAHVQLARLGPLLTHLAPVPCVLDFVDALSLNMARRAALDRGPLAWAAGLEARRMAAYERELCTQAAAGAVCAAPDRAAIGDSERLHIVGNGVDLERFPFAERAAPQCEVLFVGNLGYFPNVDAACWFARDVLPLLAARAPAVSFKLVGARPAARVRALADGDPRVRLVGPVPEVYPFLRQAAVAVAPLRAGAGQQLKILEAMAAGTPVVATSLSAAALEAADGEHLLIADDAPAMADAIARVLADPALGAAMARRARALVETRYSWQRSAEQLERLWLTAAAQR